MIDVALGILLQHGKVLVQARREEGPLDGLWEFPGGKIEPGETPRGALIRELAEETGIELQAADCELFMTEEFHYQDRSVRLHFFLCPNVERGSEKGVWIPIGQLVDSGVPPANFRAVRLLVSRFGGPAGR